MSQWRITWSKAALLRAIRATIVVPGLFALAFKVIGDAQMTLFATFGGFATLIFANFGGSRKAKVAAHLGVATASPSHTDCAFGAVLAAPIAQSVRFGAG